MGCRSAVRCVCWNSLLLHGSGQMIFIIDYSWVVAVCQSIWSFAAREARWRRYIPPPEICSGNGSYEQRPPKVWHTDIPLFSFLPNTRWGFFWCSIFNPRKWVHKPSFNYLEGFLLSRLNVSFLAFHFGTCRETTVQFYHCDLPWISLKMKYMKTVDAQKNGEVKFFGRKSLHISSHKLAHDRTALGVYHCK